MPSRVRAKARPRRPRPSGAGPSSRTPGVRARGFDERESDGRRCDALAQHVCDLHSVDTGIETAVADRVIWNWAEASTRDSTPRSSPRVTLGSTRGVDRRQVGMQASVMKGYGPVGGGRLRTPRRWTVGGLACAGPQRKTRWGAPASSGRRMEVYSSAE